MDSNYHPSAHLLEDEPNNALLFRFHFLQQEHKPHHNHIQRSAALGAKHHSTSYIIL